MFGNNNNESFKGGAPTYVGKGMRIEGKIWGKRPIWIDGEVKGTIDIGSEVGDIVLGGRYKNKRIEVKEDRKSVV